MKTGKWIIVLSVATLICVDCKKSNAGIADTNTPDFKQMTFAEVKAVADKGNPAAQFELGERFHLGNGVPKDSLEAVKWWQKSAAQKFPMAELNLGLAYGNGNGVPKNEQEGVGLCRAAADSGLARAQETMGMLYFLGAGVPKDYSQTFHWFKAAADQGWTPSQYYLALCFRDGKGTQTNLAEAITWFQRAGNSGLANAQVALGKYHFDKGFAELGIPARVKPDALVAQEQLTNQNFLNGLENGIAKQQTKTILPDKCFSFLHTVMARE
jgi:TPR repeat protein